MIGKIVESKAFGKGTISEVKENKITVAFESGTKVFKIPDAFDGFISTEDAELIAMIEAKRQELRQAAIAKEEALKAKAQEEEAAAQAVTRPAVQAVLPTKSPEFLDADEPVAFDKMSDLLNMCFGKQYKGWQHATWKPRARLSEYGCPSLRKLKTES